MSSLAQERAAALLLAALEHNNPDLPEYPDAYLRWLAAALSAALAAREQQQASFASRVRSLCFNLKSNHELRRQLCARERSAAETAAMSTAAWATEALRAERKATAQRQIRGRTRTTMEGAMLTRSVRCRVCGGREALFALLGTFREMGKTAWSVSHLGKGPARLMCLLRGAPDGSGQLSLPGRGRPTGRPAIDSGTRGSRLPPKPPISLRLTIQARRRRGVPAQALHVYPPGLPYCAYGLRVLYVRATRASLLRVLYIPEAQGNWPRGAERCTYAVRVPASGVPYVPRTVAPQAPRTARTTRRCCGASDQLHCTGRTRTAIDHNP